MHARIFAAFAELYGIMAVITCDLSARSSTASGAACLSSTVLFPNTDFLGLQPKGDDAIWACRSAGPISPKDRPALLLVVSSVVSARPIKYVIRYNRDACSHTYRSGHSNEWGKVWWFHSFLPRAFRLRPQQCRLVPRDRACRRSWTSHRWSRRRRLLPDRVGLHSAQECRAPCSFSSTQSERSSGILGSTTISGGARTPGCSYPRIAFRRSSCWRGPNGGIAKSSRPLRSALIRRPE